MNINIEFINEIFYILFGVCDKFIMSLLIIMLINFITFLLILQYNRKKLKLNNNNIKQRLIKKIYILILIILAHEIDIIISDEISIRNITICFFIANEGISI